jgi:hypothetical protein
MEINFDSTTGGLGSARRASFVLAVGVSPRSRLEEEPESRRGRHSVARTIADAPARTNVAAPRLDHASEFERGLTPTPKTNAAAARLVWPQISSRRQIPFGS